MKKLVSILFVLVSIGSTAQTVKQKQVELRADNYGLKPNALNIDSNYIVTRKNQQNVNKRGLIQAASSTHKRIDQSSIIQVSGDTLFMAATVYGSGSGDGSAAEVWGYKSGDGGSTWAYVGVVVTSANFNGVPSLYWNSTRDTVKMIYLESISGDIVFKQVYSTNFTTWSSPSTKYNPGGHFSPASDKVRRLKTDNSLVYPYSKWDSGPISGTGNWHVGILRSVNEGETWTDLGVTINGPDSYADEPDAFEFGNQLYVPFRTRVGFVYYSKATIGTWTFSASESIGVSSPSSEASFTYDKENKLFICVANRVYKPISGQPDDRYYLDVWASRDTLFRWNNVYNVADNDTNRHYLEPTPYILGDKLIVAYSDGKYFSPDYYHSLYSTTVPLGAILPHRTKGDQWNLNVMIDQDPWQQEGSFVGSSYGINFGVRKFGDSGYYKMRLNNNLTGSAGITGFAPKIDIKTFKTDRGIDQSFDRYNTYPEGAYYQYNYLLNGVSSGLSGNQLMEQHTYNSNNLMQLYADGRLYAFGRIKAGGYTTTQVGSFAGVIAGDMYYNLDSAKYFFYNGSAWVSMSGTGGSGGSATTLYSGDGSLAGNRIVNASTHYLSFTNMPNVRMSNGGSITWFFGDLSAATDNKWWGMFNENGVLGFRPYTDALSGGADFLRLDNAAGEIQFDKKLKMTSTRIDMVSPGSGFTGLYFPTYAAYAGVPSSSDAIVTGDAAGDYSLRVASGKKLQWSIDGGSTAAMKLSTSLNDGTGVAKMVTTTNGVLGIQVIPSGGGGTTTNALTFNNSGSGAASGTTFDGSTAKTLSYNSIGAMAAAKSVQTLSSQYADASNTSTTETDLLSYTLPANTLLNNGDRVEIEAIFTTPSNSNNKTLRFYFGSYSQTWSPSTIASGVTIKVKIIIVKTGTGAQRITQEFTTSFNPFPGYATSATDETATSVIKFTGQSATASSDITQRTMSVTYYPN